jgi:hypothetical protein
MTRKKREVGPKERAAVATYIGLAFGYLSFALVILCSAFLSLVEGNSLADEVSFLFFCWLFLPIPIGISGIFLAWLFVLPVERTLPAYSARRSVYLTTGGILGATVAYVILHLLLIEAMLLWELGGGWLWFAAPMVASITSGLVAGDQLWKRRPTVPEAGLVAPAPDGA